MALLYLIIALVIQGSLIYANEESSEELINNQDIINDTMEFDAVDDEVVKDFNNAQKDWIDFFFLPDNIQLYPSSSVAMMTQATTSDKSLDDQLEDIKEAAEKITLAIQSEMAKLMSYALTITENDKEEINADNNLRKKRSTESPMDSTKLITRLLKHIKSNNEYQNIAIDKMMTAQEIADKYGVEFSPDAEIISDLALAANQQAREMTSLLQDTLEMKNITKAVEPLDNDQDLYYVYPQSGYEHTSHTPTATPVINHHHHAESYPNYNYYYNYPYETQIQAPVPNYEYYSAPVTKRPDFYDTVSYSPEYYNPYCSIEPTASTTMPYSESFEPEPELVGEEFEETVTSKLYVERGDEPGSATVNHVMTYTVAEKSHFRNPEIERLPEQMQYCFFLI